VFFKLHRVLYWGNTPDQLIDFTTMDDMAAFTAEAALDREASPVLRIAGEQISAAGLAYVASRLVGKPFPLLHGGS
jgi:hypothetical protein